MSKAYTASEKYVVDESPEISVGERPGWSGKLLKFFPAFSSRNYRLYFVGQLVSLIGTWLQTVAQGWLVLQLTDSALLIGVVAAAATAPSLLFSLFGGVLVDRLDKRKILVVTQASSMILALVLGVLTVMHLINVWEIIGLAFLLGAVNSIDAPARQSFAVELVKKEDLSSAISLNSGIFNGARVIGPSVAGFLIAWVGVGGAFILNGLSYIAVIIAMLMMQLSSRVHHTHPNALRAIKEGIQYATAHPVIRLLLVFAAITSMFGWSYTTIMPVIAKNVYHLDATGLGYLYAAAGLGALSAAVFVSVKGRTLHPLRMILGGNALFVVALITFSIAPTYQLAMVCLFFSGAGLLTQFSTMNTTIQHLVEDKYRGRVMSLYTLMFMGSLPLGNLQIGYLSQTFSPGLGMQVDAIITGLFALIIWFNRKSLQPHWGHH